MDFGSLLHVAKKNENSVKKEVKFYKSTFDPPKKEQKSKALSANIQKFLARKEEEERHKAIEAKKKKDELLALRSQDGKAKKRVAAMLTRTKAANKAAIEDAVDNENTAVTLGGLAQPDEDDYGYVSQEASAFYDKLMEKYTSTASDKPKSSKKSLLKSSAADLINTKDRVRMALLREEEEEMMPHKRRRKTKEEKLKEIGSVDESHNKADYGGTKDRVEEKPEKPVKPRRLPPPPSMDFHELLKIAEKKQFEPIKIAPKVKEEDEDERPMTKKQRAEYVKEKEWRMRKEGKLPPLTASKQISRNSQPQASEERSGNQKSSHSATDSSSFCRNSGPSVDGNRGQRSSQWSVDGQREQMGSLPSGCGNKYQMNGRLSDQRSSQLLVDMSREQRNLKPFKGNRDQKSNRSSEDGNSSIPRILNVNTSGRVAKDEKSQHRIPKLNGSSSFSSSSNKTVKLQGNSDSKVGKERSRDEVRYSNMSGKPPLKNNHSSSSSVSGHGYANRDSVEQKGKDTRSCSNNSGNNGRKYNLSSYSKKLQESLLAKLQEKERSSELSEANKFRVPEAPTSKFPKSHDSGSVDGNRGSKPQSKLSRSSDLKDVSLGKSSAKPFASSQKVNETHRGTLFSESQSSLRSKVGHEIPSKDVKDRKQNQVLSKDIKHRQFSAPEVKPRQFPSPDVKSRQFPPPNVKPRQFPPADVKPRQLSPADAKQRQFAPVGVKPKQFPPADVKPRQFSPADVRAKPKPPLKRRIEDSDDEYDPELNDFIDDGPDDAEDYSKHIKEIFGYDKSRYRDMGDDECMESSFSQQLKEEYVSTKMGILEDLEDMEMEKREVARKKKMMMMKKKRRL